MPGVRLIERSARMTPSGRLGTLTRLPLIATADNKSAFRPRLSLSIPASGSPTSPVEAGNEGGKKLNPPPPL